METATNKKMEQPKMQQSSKQVMSQKEDTVSDNVKSSDEPSGARRWKTLVSFLSGALVTFAFMYFWIGNQNDVVAVVNGDEITQKEFIESAVSGGGGTFAGSTHFRKNHSTEG